jgi:penicillin amidase
MYGDAKGNIAWWASAKLPKRPAHVKPYMILDGASGKDEIEGWLDFLKIHML